MHLVCIRVLEYCLQTSEYTEEQGQVRGYKRFLIYVWILDLKQEHSHFLLACLSISFFKLTFSMETKACWELSIDRNKLYLMGGRSFSIIPPLTLTPWSFFWGNGNECKTHTRLCMADLCLCSFSWEEKDRLLLLTFCMHREKQMEFNMIKQLWPAVIFSAVTQQREGRSNWVAS